MIPAWIVRQIILKPQLRQTKGTIMATKMALEMGWAINLGGGFHNASFENGAGPSIYPDISLAIQEIR